MQEDLKRIYKCKGGVSVISTKNKTLEQIIKEVGKVIHKKEYIALDLQARIKSIKEGLYKC
jgi:hypothetical protein